MGGSAVPWPVADFKHIGIKDVNGIAVVQFVNSQLMFATNVVDEIGDELESLILESDWRIRKSSSITAMASPFRARCLPRWRNCKNTPKSPSGSSSSAGSDRSSRTSFRIGHLERLFSVYEDAESALKSF